MHGVNDSGKPMLVKPKILRADLLPLIAQLPPCLIGMVACSGAPHWARQFRQHGHTVKLMAPKFVAPYRMTGRRGKPVLSLAKGMMRRMLPPPAKPSPNPTAVRPVKLERSSRAAKRRQRITEEREALM